MNLPPQLATREIRFIKVHEKSPVEVGWNILDLAELQAHAKDKFRGRLNNYEYDDPEFLEWIEHDNYGVLTGAGGFVVFDADNLPQLGALGIIDKLPDTFTVRTGRGGLHFYLLCPGFTKKIVLEDPVLKDGEGKPLHLGELQTVGQFVVGPGSRHPNDNFYEVVKDLPIATITKGELLQILAPLKLAEAEQAGLARRRSSGGSSLGDLIPIDQVARPKDIKEQAGAEVRGSHPLHGSTTGKNFSINTAKNCWHCFRHNTGGGPLEWLAIEAGLIRCEDAKPGCLSNGLFKKALEIARDRGFDVPDNPQKDAGSDPAIKSVAQETFTDDIKARALEILQTGDPVQYVVDSCGRMALGAEKAFKKLICCVSVQSIRQSSGLHPKLAGNSSGGKTWTAYTFAHHLPKEAVVKGSMSAKAGFYHYDGDRVFRILDDYQAGNEDLDTVIKQTTSEFHEKFIHRTVIKQKPATLEIGSEQTWAITSIDNEQDIQVLNRAIPINVDDSEDLTRRVNNHTVERYGKGEPAKLLDDTVLICRAMFQILRDEGYVDVRVPFYDRIEWIDTSNRRNPSIFMDLVVAHTAMFRYQREKDSEGFYLATEDDFVAAKELFNDQDAEELVRRFTKRERDVIELLIAHPGGLTREEIAARLQPPVATDRVTQILNGQRGRGGLMQKVQLKITIFSDMEEISGGIRRSTQKKTYSIQNYNHFEGFDAVVRLRPRPATGDDGGNHREEEPPKSTKHELIDELSTVTTMQRDELSKLSIKEEDTKENDAKETEKVLCENSLSSQENTKFTKPISTDSEDEAKLILSRLSPSSPDAEMAGLAHPVDSPAAQDAVRDQHFAEKAAEVAANSSRDEPTPVIDYEQAEPVRFNTEAPRETISYVAGDECVAPLDHPRNIVTIPHIDVSMDGLGGDAEKRCTQDSLQDQIPNLEVVEISSLPAWKGALQEIAQAGICGLDLETTGLDPLSSRARLAQLSLPSGRVYVADLWELDREGGSPIQDLGQLSERSDIKKVGHNLKFDLAFIQVSCGRRLHISNIFDTMLASQVCWAGYYASGEMVQTLRSIAKRHLGIDLPKELQASDWGAEVLSAEQIAYAARDAGVLLPLHDILQELLKRNDLEQIAELEFGVIPSVIELELRGLPLDVEACRAMIDEKRLQLQKITQNFQARGLNPNSPKQLLAFLQSQGYNIPSTKEESLKELVAAGCSFAEEILQYRRLAKQVKFLDDWLQRFSPIDGRLHSTYFQLSTRSGRFSSKNPNAQQIPKRGEDGQAMRRLFKAPPGKKIIKGDFSGIELRIMARLSQDKTMIEAFQAGQDLHKLTASRLAGVPIDRVTKEQRQSAKSANFGLIYGVSACGFRENAQIQYGVNMSQEEAEQIRNAFFATYPGVQAFHRTQKALKQHPQTYIFHNAEQGFYSTPMVCIQTISGRKRIWDWENGQNLARDTMLYNSPSQGTGADLIKAVMAEVYNSLPEDVKMIGSVHDELLLEAPEASAKEIADLLLSIMRRVGSELLFPVPVDAEVEIVDSWGGS